MTNKNEIEEAIADFPIWHGESAAIDLWFTDNHEIILTALHLARTDQIRDLPKMVDSGEDVDVDVEGATIDCLKHIGALYSRPVTVETSLVICDVIARLHAQGHLRPAHKAEVAPDGFVLVPVEPTDEMRIIGRRGGWNPHADWADAIESSCGNIYKSLGSFQL